MLLLLVAVAAQAQFSEKIQVIAVEIPISVRDRDGKVPPDLTKDDFEVFEDGERQEVIGLSYPVALVPITSPTTVEELRVAPQRKWQIVVFVQQSMSSSGGLRTALRSVRDQATRLASLGDVEIVSDYPVPHVLLPATNDANALRDKLNELQRRIIGHEEVMRLRRAYEPRRRISGRITEQRSPISEAVSAAQMEAWIVRKRQDLTLAWMARYAAGAGSGPRLLLFISDGYSLDPIRFYITPDGETDEDLSELRSLNAAPRQDDIARAIAAQGWTVYSLAPGALQHTLARSYTEMRSSEALRPGRFVNLIDVLDPMRMLTAETGGKLATDPGLLARDVDSFSQRLTLAYQARRPHTGKPRRLEVRSRRPGLRVEAQKTVGSGTPEVLAAARAAALALNFGERGELPVRCEFRPGANRDEETLHVFVDVSPLSGARAALTSATVRVAVTVAPEKALPFDQVQMLENLDFSTKSLWDIEFPIRKRGGARTAVVAEEVFTGIWGGASCGTP